MKSHRKIVTRRAWWGLPRRLALLSAAALLATSCGEPEVQCETFDYGGTHIVLAVPSGYYAFPSKSSAAGISLRFRYRDLTAREDWTEKFNANEMNDPHWSIDTSNYATQLRISRREFVRKSSLDDFRPGYRSVRAIPTDWEGWTKLELCPNNCSEFFYLSETWRGAGVANVGCYEVEWRAPKYISCSAEDTLHGLQVNYWFPVTKKAHFAEFRQRIAGVIGLMAERAKTMCPTGQQ